MTITELLNMAYEHFDDKFEGFADFRKYAVYHHFYVSDSGDRVCVVEIVDKATDETEATVCE